MNIMDERAILIKELGDTLLYGPFVTALMRETVRDNLHLYSDELLLKMKHATSPEESVRQGGCVTKVRRRVEKKDSEESIREAICFFPVLDGLSERITNFLLESLHHYYELPSSKDYSSESPEVIAQCNALLEVAITVLDMEATRINGNWTIGDKQLVEVVLTNTERSGDIAEFIRARGTADPEVIKGMLQSTAPALNNGLL